MMRNENTLAFFKAKKEKTIRILNNLCSFIEQGENLGIAVDVKLKAKLQTALLSTEHDKLKIALIGGISEGKTSIAAAWMERLDKAGMKISHKESSNEVKIYEIGSDMVLIDTPGLFGFKEQFNEDTQSIEKYKEITKKFVSEAHLVLYVMNPANPIKASHKEDLHWLFRVLNLLDRTIFVLGRFDEVADLEDEEDYQANFLIKSKNVIASLQNHIQLTREEEENLSIVAVAANPFDKGVEYWLSHPEQFRILSHIAMLQDATTEKIKRQGGAVALVEEAKNSVIRDVLDRQLPTAIKNNETIKDEVERMGKLNMRLGGDIENAKKSIDRAKIDLREFVLRHFSYLINELEGTSLETFSGFFEDEVGNEGIVLSTRLQNEFESRLSSAGQSITNKQLSYEAEINHYNDTLTAMGQQGVKFLLGAKVINNKSILAARDGVKTVFKFVGVDLGNLLKFKPWGAVNLAKGLNGLLSVAGIGLELWDAYQQYEREEKFKKMKDNFKKNFEKQREELLALLGDGFEERFFPEYIHMHQQMAELDENLAHSKERLHQFDIWRARAEAIDVEFRQMEA